MIPSSISVTLAASGTLDRSDFWGDALLATRVEYGAVLSESRIVVSVTAYTDTHQNVSWYDPRYFVAAGLNEAAPPEWVPPAPDWFWPAVEQMAKP